MNDRWGELLAVIRSVGDTPGFAADLTDKGYRITRLPCDPYQQESVTIPWGHAHPKSLRDIRMMLRGLGWTPDLHQRLKDHPDLPPEQLAHQLKAQYDHVLGGGDATDDEITRVMGRTRAVLTTGQVQEIEALLGDVYLCARGARSKLEAILHDVVPDEDSRKRVVGTMIREYAGQGADLRGERARG